MSASGLAVRFINILVTTLRFALAVLNLASPFLRSAGGLFIDVYRLLFYVDWTEKGNSLQPFCHSVIPKKVTDIIDTTKRVGNDRIICSLVVGAKRVARQGVDKSGIRCGPLCKCEGPCSNNEI